MVLPMIARSGFAHADGAWDRGYGAAGRGRRGSSGVILIQDVDHITSRAGE